MAGWQAPAQYSRTLAAVCGALRWRRAASASSSLQWPMVHRLLCYIDVGARWRSDVQAAAVRLHLHCRWGARVAQSKIWLRFFSQEENTAETFNCRYCTSSTESARGGGVTLLCPLLLLFCRGCTRRAACVCCWLSSGIDRPCGWGWQGERMRAGCLAFWGPNNCDSRWRPRAGGCPTGG